MDLLVTATVDRKLTLFLVLLRQLSKFLLLFVLLILYLPYTFFAYIKKSSQVTNDKLRQHLVISISKITTLNKASHGDIQLSRGQVRYTFTSSCERDQIFDLIYNIWRSVAQPFDSMLPNLQVSVYCALTTFESGISPWMHPSEWLNANVEHIRAIFDGIVDLTGNKPITFPATMIFQVC